MIPFSDNKNVNNMETTCIVVNENLVLSTELMKQIVNYNKIERFVRANRFSPYIHKSG